MTPNPSDKLLQEEILVRKPEEKHIPGQQEHRPSATSALQALDVLFACLVVAPLVVGVWRGCWGLMDLNSLFFPPWQSYILGMLIHVCFSLVRSHLLARSTGARSGRGGSGTRWTRERMLARCYTVVFMLACILQWRGGWGVLDATIEAVVALDDPRRPAVVASVTASLVCAASALRVARNLLASPYFLVTDGKEPTYIFTTRFKKNSGRDTALYVLDCVFSVGVVGSLVVFVWRGLWTLLDIFLYPDDPATSNWASLIARKLSSSVATPISILPKRSNKTPAWITMTNFFIHANSKTLKRPLPGFPIAPDINTQMEVIGYVLVTLSFGLQAPMRWACSRLHGAPRLLLADLFHIFSFAATVNVWRGYWGLLEMYFLPDNPRLSNWISHTTSLTLLMLLNCSNSVLVRGVYIDAEEPAGECVVFPCHYLRLFFHRERTKKRHRRALLAAAAAAARKSEDAAAAPLAPLASLAQEKV